MARLAEKALRARYNALVASAEARGLSRAEQTELAELIDRMKPQPAAR